MIRGETVEERARALAKSGKTASAGGMFRFLGNMMYNGEELLLARKIQREMKEKEKQAEIDKADKVMEELFAAADRVYEKFVECDECIQGLNSNDLKALVKFIVKIENKPNDTFSKHKNVTLLKARLAECDPSWTKYFAPVPDDSEFESRTDDHGLEGAA